MRHRAYPEYRESGVDWVGEMPTHWTVARLQDCTYLLNGFPFESEHFSRDTGIPLVRIRDLGGDTTEVLYDGAVVPEAIVVNGDILVGMDGDFNVARWQGGRAQLNQRMCCLRPSALANTQFLSYLLSFPLKVINDLTYSTTVKHLSSDEVRKVRFGLPAPTEQRTIATFLDRETTQIDSLVAKKQRLIELLHEKRTALISRVVTKGLDPSVPMKDSGVDWLGPIPTQWTVTPAMRLTALGRPIMYGIVLPGPNVQDGVAIVKGGDVAPGGLRRDSLDRTTFEIEAGHLRSRLRGGDIVYAIRGSIGAAEIVPDELEGANLTQDAARISPASGFNTVWLLFALRSRPVFAQLEGRATGATIRGINIRDLKRACIPVPPTIEQDAIAAFLDCETAKIDALVGKVREAIERLREYRTALVSAAVTGKIDVRERGPGGGSV